MVLENSIADLVHQYVELFFRSERLQMYCLKWTNLLKKLLLGKPDPYPRPKLSITPSLPLFLPSASTHVRQSPLTIIVWKSASSCNSLYLAYWGKPC